LTFGNCLPKSSRVLSEQLSSLTIISSAARTFSRQRATNCGLSQVGMITVIITGTGDGRLSITVSKGSHRYSRLDRFARAVRTPSVGTTFLRLLFNVEAADFIGFARLKIRPLTDIQCPAFLFVQPQQRGHHQIPGLRIGSMAKTSFCPF